MLFCERRSDPPEGILNMNKDKFLTSVELRRLLFSLMDSRPDVGIRFRFIGQMWQGDYSRIVKVTGKGGLFSDEKTSRIYGIQNLDNVVQFEIDQRFQEFEPHFHYSILPVAVL
jgi:hypothetical protein